jgi:outer membrane protein
MKRILLLTLILAGFLSTTMAQKYAFVDTDYILENIPHYRSAQEQLDQISKQYQKELENLHSELDQMFKDFQAEAVLLSNDMKRRREDVIVSKEKEYKKLQRQYFGPEGDLFQKRQSLVNPIQDDIFNAIQEIASLGSYAVIFDKAAGVSLLYTNPKYDLSDQVLEKLGYKN